MENVKDKAIQDAKLELLKARIQSRKVNTKLEQNMNVLSMLETLSSVLSTVTPVNEAGASEQMYISALNEAATEAICKKIVQLTSKLEYPNI